MLSFSESKKKGKIPLLTFYYMLFFEISFDGLVNNTASTKKQVFNVKSSDYDRVTKTVYLRYQPAFQNCTAFKLNIKSDLAIKRLAIGYSSEGVPVIAKNNI